MTDLDRIAQLQERLGRQDIDIAVLRLAENVLLATGYYVQMGGLGLAVVPREGRSSLLIPDYEAQEAAESFAGEIRTFPATRLDGPPTGAEIERHLRELADAWGTGGRIGYEGSFEAVAPPTLAGEPNAVALPTQMLLRDAFEAAELVDVTAELEDIRAVKSDHDLQRLGVVNEIAMIGLDAFKRHARPGITEVGLAAEVEAAMLRDGHGYRGARVVRGYATIASGPQTALAWRYFRSSTRVIEPDDVVMIELGTVADGYWADNTRTTVAGTPSARQRQALEVSRSAGLAAFAAARPGASGGQVDAASREHCAQAGFEQFLHHTGHGTGFRYHESRPQIVPDGSHILKRRMVIATEPGIYEEGLGGFRWEDNAVVELDGARVLATSDDWID